MTRNVYFRIRLEGLLYDNEHDLLEMAKFTALQCTCSMQVFHMQVKKNPNTNSSYVVVDL